MLHRNNVNPQSAPGVTPELIQPHFGLIMDGAACGLANTPEKVCPFLTALQAFSAALPHSVDMRVKARDDRVLISKPTHSSVTQHFPLTLLFYLSPNNSPN